MARSKTDTSTDAVLYLRVSTQEQAREGISLAAQEARLRAYCELRGLRVVEVVIDAGVSGGQARAQPYRWSAYPGPGAAQRCGPRGDVQARPALQGLR